MTLVSWQNNSCPRDARPNLWAIRKLIALRNNTIDTSAINFDPQVLLHSTMRKTPRQALFSPSHVSPYGYILPISGNTLWRGLFYQIDKVPQSYVHLKKKTCATQTVFVYSCPECLRCLAHLNTLAGQLGQSGQKCTLRQTNDKKSRFPALPP